MVVDVNYVIKSDVTGINIQWRQLAPSEMAIPWQLHASDAKGAITRWDFKLDLGSSWVLERREIQSYVAQNLGSRIQV